jgi:hypothetical protein
MGDPLPDRPTAMAGIGTRTRRCERAVVTAYRELRGTGIDDLSAFRACTTLYRVHHPEASLAEARRLVAEWVHTHVHAGSAGAGARGGMAGA